MSEFTEGQDVMWFGAPLCGSREHNCMQVRFVKAVGMGTGLQPIAEVATCQGIFTVEVSSLRERNPNTIMLAEDAPIGVQLWPTTTPAAAANVTLREVQIVRNAERTYVRWVHETGSERLFSLGESVCVRPVAAQKPAEQGGPGVVATAELTAACFHPLSCSGCQRNGRACGLHRVGDVEHTHCTGA